MNARIAAARHDMQAFGIRGVPALIVGSGSRRRLHDSAVLFDSNTDVVLNSVLPNSQLPCLDPSEAQLTRKMRS
jgi:hypothetical protein